MIHLTEIFRIIYYSTIKNRAGVKITPTLSRHSFFIFRESKDQRKFHFITAGPSVDADMIRHSHDHPHPFLGGRDIKPAPTGKDRGNIVKVILTDS